MKRFTFTLMVLLILLGGVSIQAQTDNLPIKGGYHWTIVNSNNQESNQNEQGEYKGDTYYSSGKIKFKDGSSAYNGNIGRSCVGGTEWAETLEQGDTQTFTITLESSGNTSTTLCIATLSSAISSNGRYNNYTPIEYASIDTSSETELTLEVTKSYGAIYLYQTSQSGWPEINIKSITRTVRKASSVASPTISPASGTYDGDLTVTITKGEGNDKVVYSVSGATTGNVTNAEFTENSKPLDLTGTGTITVTATGYKGGYASSEVTNTYTYSIPDGKTNVPFAIPYTAKTAKYTYTFENGDNISSTGFSSTSVTSDDKFTGNNSFKATNGVKDHDWDSQFYINLNSSDWPDGTKAILHFAIKGSGSKEKDAKMEVALQQNSGLTPMCGLFEEDLIIPTDSWKEYNLPTTVDFSLKGATYCDKLYFNCGKWNGDLFIDDVILYKITEETSGGSNVFTSDEQVANIASSAFTNLTAGDYICADVTGTPETIKLVCNGTDYALTQFNGGTLWGIKATDEMVTALQANNSEFKGHDLTLNGINIYKTKTISQTASDNSITLVNNTFVEQNRPFAANKWFVCHTNRHRPKPPCCSVQVTRLQGLQECLAQRWNLQILKASTTLWLADLIC